MIKSLQIKLIAVSMGSLLIVLTIVAGCINFISYSKAIDDADTVLSMLVANDGSFPPPDRISKDGPRHISPEISFESRYFTVRTTLEGNITSVNTDFIISVDSDTATNYAIKLLESKKTKGFFLNYRYVITDTTEGKLLIFLDCGRSLGNVQNVLLASLLVCSFSFFAVFLLVFAISGRVIKPIIDSYEKQKRFITDAGHELKTPLTIINADADVLELDFGESEWIDDIKAQTKRLSSLTTDLIYLAKMEEHANSLVLELLDISVIIAENISSFEAPAKLQNKNLIYDIETDIFTKVDKKSLQQLVNILMDNALKYSPEDTHIYITLKTNKKKVTLTIQNQTLQPITDDLENIFERFYRLDPSRNSETGGHGIGLSVAKAIAIAHKGSIHAQNMDGMSLSIQVTIPHIAK